MYIFACIIVCIRHIASYLKGVGKKKVQLFKVLKSYSVRGDGGLEVAYFTVYTYNFNFSNTFLPFTSISYQPPKSEQAYFMFIYFFLFEYTFLSVNLSIGSKRNSVLLFLYNMCICISSNIINYRLVVLRGQEPKSLSTIMVIISHSWINYGILLYRLRLFSMIAIYNK